MISCTFYVSDFSDFTRQTRGLNSPDFAKTYSDEWGEEFRNSALVGFELNGHADSAPYGEDIVCAACTALAMSALTALNDILNLEPDYLIYDGYLKVGLSDIEKLTLRQIQDADLIIESLFLGLRQINESYDEKYLRLHTDFYQTGFGGQNNDED